METSFAETLRIPAYRGVENSFFYEMGLGTHHSCPIENQYRCRFGNSRYNATRTGTTFGDDVEDIHPRNGTQMLYMLIRRVGLEMNEVNFSDEFPSLLG